VIRLFSVTVLLPVYNGEIFLQQAVISVLSQGDGIFELLIIDDGSTDRSSEVLSNIEGPDVRVYQQANRGLAGTLNRGLELASGSYIARHDQDDLILPGRLAKQVEFLNNNPDCAMVGTWADIWVGDQPSHRCHRHPASHETLCLELLFDNPFVHSSVMMRTEVVRRLGGYCEDKSRQPPEDYELWSRIAREYRVANIPEVLTIYREVGGSMSRTGDNPFLNNLIKISSENLAAILAPEVSIAECFALSSLYHGRLADDKKKVLSRARALQLHERAASVVGGDIVAWSDEFRVSFLKQQAQIKSQFIRRHLPRGLVDFVRPIKRFLFLG
jgi:hypothetical protein